MVHPRSYKDCATYTGSSRSVRSRSPGSERDDRGRDRKGHKDDARDESRRGEMGTAVIVKNGIVERQMDSFYCIFLLYFNLIYLY
ncbi:hypothetical protein NC651_037969 [Populus alba x Populus x berolinensis]|nr:hypothetical protein NC651_037969 [Populus alba x Populus x berolinensis]